MMMMMIQPIVKSSDKLRKGEGNGDCGVSGAIKILSISRIVNSIKRHRRRNWEENLRVEPNDYPDNLFRIRLKNKK